MGSCDIHMYVEYKKTIKDKSMWISGDYFKANPYYKIRPYAKEYARVELHGLPDYSLFSILAGVRDYTGKVIPVSEPRGIPEDACEFVKSENESWDINGHTHSWLTLKEIRDYQASNPKIYHTGVLSPEDLIAFDKYGKYPLDWCQGTSEPGYERREWSEDSTSLVPLIEKMQQRAKELLQFEWDEYDFKNDENIRIVFWFDN